MKVVFLDYVIKNHKNVFIQKRKYTFRAVEEDE